MECEWHAADECSAFDDDGQMRAVLVECAIDPDEVMPALQARLGDPMRACHKQVVETAWELAGGNG